MAIEKSGFCYTNKMARIYMMSIEKTIGLKAMQLVWDLAEIPPDDRPPPNNFAKEFDFAYFGAINAAVGKLYGERGERSLTSKAGHDSFAGGLAEYGAMTGVGELALKSISLGIKIKIALRAMAETFSKFSDQSVSLDESSDYFIYTIHHCPACWGRTSRKPSCYAAIGVLEAGLHWVSNGKQFRIEEVTCHAMGDRNCAIHVWKEPLILDVGLNPHCH